MTDFHVLNVVDRQHYKWLPSNITLVMDDSKSSLKVFETLKKNTIFRSHETLRGYLKTEATNQPVHQPVEWNLSNFINIVEQSLLNLRNQFFPPKRQPKVELFTVPPVQNTKLPMLENPEDNTKEDDGMYDNTPFSVLYPNYIHPSCAAHQNPIDDDDVLLFPNRKRRKKSFVTVPANNAHQESASAYSSTPSVHSMVVEANEQPTDNNMPGNNNNNSGDDGGDNDDVDGDDDSDDDFIITTQHTETKVITFFQCFGLFFFSFSF